MNDKKAITVLNQMIDVILTEDKHLIKTKDVSEAKALERGVEAIEAVGTYKNTIEHLNKENANLREKVTDLENRIYGLHKCCDCKNLNECSSQLDEDEESIMDRLTYCENFEPKENEHDGE